MATARALGRTAHALTPTHPLIGRVATRSPWRCSCASRGRRAPVAAAPPVPAANAAVITTWNQIAVSTVTAAGASPTALQLLRVRPPGDVQRRRRHHRRYELYQWNAHGAAQRLARGRRRRSSAPGPVTYFPAQRRDPRRAARRLPGPRAGRRPQDKGIAYGVRAADHIIALRANDGRDAAVTVPPADAAATGSRPAGAPSPCRGSVASRRWRSIATQFDPGAAAGHRLADLPRGVQRGPRLRAARTAVLRTRGADADRPVLLGRRHRADAGRAARRRRTRRAGHQRQRALFAAVEHRHRRWRDHGLERQAPVHVVAAGHGHPPWPITDGNDATACGSGLEAADHHAPVSGLAERPVLGRRRADTRSTRATTGRWT